MFTSLVVSRISTPGMVAPLFSSARGATRDELDRRGRRTQAHRETRGFTQVQAALDATLRPATTVYQ
jgi:hypothetical protein